jgi:YidC/Oxa1 family membrane protein insertase
MQRLKPQLDALKAKYKNNMRKYNEEQMAILKAEGVRPPLGGCLLIFLQFPIWVSLFQVLRSNIELRHAPFILWVNDLSSPDRMPFPIVGTIHLLPILMAAAQVIQMRLQPKPADDSQAQMQRMMGFLMPIMMLVFLYRYPSGLALYIFTSSLFGIVEYQIVKRLWPVPVVAPVGVVAGKGKKS